MADDAAPRSPIRGSDILLVVLLVLGASLSIDALLPAGLRSGGAIVAALAVQTGIMLAALYLVVIVWRGATWQALGLRPAPSAWYGRAVGIALLTIPVVALINAGIAGFQEGAFRNPQIALVSDAATTIPAAIGMLAIAAIVVPFVEELAFRGLLYGWLRERMGVAPAVAGSALVFPMLHGIPLLMPALFVQGAILALVYEKSGSLWPAIVVHGVFNAVMMIGLYAALQSGVPLDQGGP